MMIAEYNSHEGKSVQVYKIDDLYTVFSDGVMVQLDLDADSFVRYACWALDSAHYLLKKKLTHPTDPV